MNNKIKQLILLAGDLAILYLALYLALWLRYFGQPISASWNSHVEPFSFIFIFWIIIFYIFNLYNLNYSVNNQKFWGLSVKATTVSGLLSVAFFYLNPEIGIAPKRNILIFIAIFLLLFFLWRRTFNWLLKSYLPKNNIAVIGLSQEVEDLINDLNKKPHLGYGVKFILANENGKKIENIPIYANIEKLENLIKQFKIATLVLSSNPNQSDDLRSILFKCLPLKINYLNLADFYEQTTGRVPLDLINQMWFLENLSEGNKKIFDFLKRSFDIILSILILLVSFPFWPLIGLALRIESKETIFFTQARAGRNNKIFRMVKFRTQRTVADIPEPSQKNDPRNTKVGAFLRKTRIDELPQIINILRGQMSFVGPRPERPELIQKLEQKIPFYSERTLVKPGITGWDQISGEYHSPSLEDTYKKLQFDLYYIKNRSLYLDLSIILKTIYTMLNKEGQ